MKKLGLTILLVAAAQTLSAQSLVVTENGVNYSFPASGAGEMLFGAGRSLEIMGKQFTLSSNTDMEVVDADVPENTVLIEYKGDKAEVTVAGNIARYVTVAVTDARVSVIQSDEVSADNCGEITYYVSGASDNGSLLLEGSFKSTVELHGLTLTNPRGAAIDIQNGKRIAVSVSEGTENFLTDGSDGDWKGCIVCKGHLEFKGHGSLTVSGNTSHAIYAKEYIEVKNCTINVISAIKDGINCNQYFLLKSGEINISGVGDDAIQTSFKDDADREAEDTGTITIAGGTLKATVTATASKGIKADGDISVTGGDIEISVSGGGLWDSSKNKTKASACMGADGKVTIDGGTLKLTATGSGGKGISCDGTLTVNGGDIDVTTSGGMFAYVNGKIYDNYTGNSDSLSSDSKSSPKGIKADDDIEINGGIIRVTTSGNGGEGIESKATLTVNDGTIYVNAYDDAINSSSHMYIKGGDITVIATNNDGLDSNGNMYISGGVIRAFGASAPECGIDAAEEQGYSVIFTGGMLLAVGGSNSVPSKSESTQPYISGSGTATADTVIELKDGDQVLASFTVPSDYKGGTSSSGGGRPGGGWGGSRDSSILISCPGLTNGNSYTLVNGTSSSSVSARLTGSGGGGRPW